MSFSKCHNWDQSTRDLLVLSGWYPNRDVWDKLEIPPQPSVFPEAKRILSEFGNLVLEHRQDDARVDLRPTLAHDVLDDLRAYSQLVGSPLFPLGVADGCDYMYLIVDERGYVYTLTDQLEPFSSSFDKAIAYLVRGAMNRRAWEEDLKSANLLGKVWKLS